MLWLPMGLCMLAAKRGGRDSTPVAVDCVTTALQQWHFGAGLHFSQKAALAEIFAPQLHWTMVMTPQMW